MAGTHFALNTTMKVSAKRAAGYTVVAGELVVATYQGQTGSVYGFPHFQVWYAPGDSVAATVSTNNLSGSPVACSLVTAVGMINSP